MAGKWARVDGLTPREADVLRLVASGLTDSGVATSLGMTKHTVHSHMRIILQKTQSISRAQAVLVAHERGWLE